MLFRFFFLLPALLLLCIVKCIAQDYRELGYYVKDSTHFDSYPVFPGGKNKLRNYTHVDFVNSPLYRRVFYKTKTTGFILVKYNLDSTGIVSNPLVNTDRLAFDQKKTDMTQIDNIKQEVTDKLKDIFNKMPRWSPAILNGKKVSTTLISPIYLPPW